MNADPLLQCWRAAWPQALAVWSKYTRLHDPLLCTSHREALEAGLADSFAMIRLVDKSVVIDLTQVRTHGLEDFAPEILAHEIGHHVLAPATLGDQFRLLARVRAALPTLEKHVAMVANLYADLLINDRLQREGNLRMAEVFRRLAARAGAGNRVWELYMAIYEELWKLEPGSLGGLDDDASRGDAWLGARVIRVYARDWLNGAGRFASAPCVSTVLDHL